MTDDGSRDVGLWANTSPQPAATPASGRSDRSRLVDVTPGSEFLSEPLDPLTHDLYPWVRRHWANCGPGTIEHHVLRVARVVSRPGVATWRIRHTGRCEGEPSVTHLPNRQVCVVCDGQKRERRVEHVEDLRSVERTCSLLLRRRLRSEVIALHRVAAGSMLVRGMINVHSKHMVTGMSGNR